MLVQSCDVHRTDDLHSFLKVFHIFVICVKKWQQKKCLSTTKSIKNIKCDSISILENILEYHRFQTMDFKDESWESANIRIPMYCLLS